MFVFRLHRVGIATATSRQQSRASHPIRRHIGALLAQTTICSSSRPEKKDIYTSPLPHHPHPLRPGDGPMKPPPPGPPSSSPLILDPGRPSNRPDRHVKPPSRSGWRRGTPSWSPWSTARIRISIRQQRHRSRPGQQQRRRRRWSRRDGGHRQSADRLPLDDLHRRQF